MSSTQFPRDQSVRRGVRRFWLSLVLPLVPIIVWAADSATRPAVEKDATTTAAPANSADTKVQLAQRRTELGERITRLDRLALSADGPTADSATLDLEHLKRIDLLLMQHEAAIEFLAEQREELAEWTKDLETLRAEGIGEPRPYPQSLQDDTDDELDAEAARQQSAASDTATARLLLAAAQEDHETSQRERRRTLEETADDSESPTADQGALQRKEAELACVVAAELVALRRVELDVRTAHQAACQARRAYYDEKAKLVSGHVVFAESEMHAQLARMRKSADELRKRINELERRLKDRPAEEAAARERLTAASAEDDVIEEAHETFQVIRRALHERMAMINQRISEFNRFHDLVQWRYQAASGQANLDELASWRETINEYREQLTQTEAGLTRRVDDLRLDVSTYRGRLRKIDDQESLRREWIETRIRETHDLAEECEFGIIQLKMAQRGLHRCLEAIEARLPSHESTPISERLAAWWSGLWSFELAAVDDHPITVAKVVGALTYLFVGILLARFISHVAGRRLLPRVGMDRGASLAVQSITFYLLCAVGGFLALEFAHLPLTAFTFLGGAAAIGIGFGSQNILNNFISGLILLAEQPIRVGDVVELNGTYGTVEHIGLRSTRVKTGANFELIVPNSKLLENNVVNLTLSDNNIRTKVVISVAYGSPVADVKQLLEAAAFTSQNILATPAPSVLLTNFGPTALEFELHFSIRIQSFGECRTIESEVREAIDELYHAGSMRFASARRETSATVPPQFDFRAPAPASRRVA